MQVRILHTDRPRIPGEGSSALGKSGPKARSRDVADGQQVEIPVLYGNRTVGTQRESTSREWKALYKRGRSALGKSGAQSEDVMWSEPKGSEAGEPAVEKSRYCFVRTRTVNRHRWMRRES